MSKTEELPAGPLSGLRVLDTATFVAAPFAASVLSEFGAEVIKIEQPGSGDPWRRYGSPTDNGDTLAWKSEARNKRSVTLNLSSPDGGAIFKELVASSDVMCENFRPGTLERWGLGWDVLVDVNPKLILLRVSGYGQDGPYRDRPGFARTAHAYAGLTHLAGMPDGPPVTPGSTSLADYVSGLFGAVGILIALRARDATQHGQIIDVSLYESIFRVLDEVAPAYAETGLIRGREGTKTLNACPHGQYQTADNRWVALACTSDRMFARLASMMGRPVLAAPEHFGQSAHRLAHYEEVDRLVTEFVAQHQRDAFVELCVVHEVPCAPVNTIADIFADPHFRLRQTIVEIADENGHVVAVPNVVPRLSQTPGEVKCLGPELGADTERVLKDLVGLTDDQLYRLRASRTI